jgi:hypothetical protein
MRERKEKRREFLEGERERGDPKGYFGAGF